MDQMLHEALTYMSAVFLEGARYVGKTETARQIAKSEVLLDVDEGARMSALVHPEGVLSNEPPLLIDEWQFVPELWNHVRRSCDARQLNGQFILTGSAQPSDSITHHSGAGRIARLKLLPMTLVEQGISDHTISLRNLLGGEEVSGTKPKATLSDLVELSCKGGWPAMVSSSLAESLKHVRAYLEEITRVELFEDLKFDPSRLRQLLISLARNVATDVSITTLQKDVNSKIQSRTITKYLDQLVQIHIVELLMPWATHLRTRSQLRLTPKRFFCDPSLAVAALRATPDKLIDDLQYFGLLFESLVIRDLLVYARANDAKVTFYRDNTGLEIDAIVESSDGIWIPIEIKLGGSTYIEAAAKALIRLEQRVDLEKKGKPVAKLIITSTPVYPHTRPDGVSVLSIASLGP